MSDTVIRCDTPGSGSGPSSGSGIGHDSGLGFDESSYSVAFLEKLREQRDAQRFCDVTIRIDGASFSAHRAVLAACSPYFETLLDGSRIVRQTVAVASHAGGHAAFSIVLQFMYTGISALNCDVVLDVMKFSERFRMSQLRDRCVDFLQQHMTPANCFRTKEMALGLGLTGLVRIVDAYIVANAVDIADSGSSNELSHAHLEELIGRSMPLSEIDRIRLISRWVEQKEDRRRRMPALIATYVQWQKVGPMELCSFLRGCVEKSNSETAQLSDWCLYRVLQSLKDSCLLPDIYFERLAKLRDSFVVDESAQAVGTCLTNDARCLDETDDNDVAVEVEDFGEDVETEKHENALQSAAGVENGDSHLISSTSSAEHEQETFYSTVNAEVLAPPDSSPPNQTDNCMTAFSSNQQHSTRQQKRKRVSGQHSECKRQRQQISADKTVDTNCQKDSTVKTVSPLCQLNGANNSEGNQQKLKAQKAQKPASKRRKTNRLRNIRCHECLFRAQTVEKLRNHMRTAHRDKQTFSCSLCSFKAHWNREYYKHMATHFSGPPYVCSSCSFKTERIRLLVIHLMDHTDSRPYSCRTCGIRFKMRNNLVAHQRCHSGLVCLSVYSSSLLFSL